MCGIVGHISLKTPVSIQELEAACQTLKHRGPDGQGVELINETIGFGHTRLSFLDLSEHGSQPMLSNDASLCITFNGEIYNYLELRQELEAHYPFSSNSDTEVILAAYKHWGIEMLDRLEGMFALALYDKNTNQLYLARDRFGIKPLYYHKKESTLLFGSELKAFGAFAAFEKAVDYSSFCDYFVYRYVPSPKTIWKDCFKVPPANYLRVDAKTLEMKEVLYWEPTFGDKSSKNLVDFVDKCLEDSIKKHARADVPIGAFLSGGYDSSAIVAYLKELKYSPQTFSIGFENWEKSEDQFAAIVSKHLALENKRIVAGKESLDLIELMPDVYDEPIADISIIPTYLVSQLAAKDVKAVMGGEGADEIFGGYHWQKEYYAQNNPSSFMDKIKLFFKDKDPVAFYANAMSMGAFDQSELKKMLEPSLHQHIPEDVHWFYRKHYKSQLSPLKSIQYLDMKCFMGELVLVKVDRASMANSLEVRVPFLNNQLYDKVFSSAEQAYYKKDSTKYLLYENIKDKLPETILERKKQGFVGPDSYYMDKSWYRTQLKDSLLVKHKIIKRSYIDSLLEKDYDWRIWKILVMEKWFAKWAV